MQYALLALTCVASPGCAAAMEEQRAAENAPTANVAGAWTGWAGTGRVSVNVTLTQAQNGTALTGDVSVAGRPDLSGPVSGAVQGELVKLSTATAVFTQLRARQDTLQGAVGPMTPRRSQ